MLNFFKYFKTNDSGTGSFSLLSKSLTSRTFRPFNNWVVTCYFATVIVTAVVVLCVFLKIITIDDFHWLFQVQSRHQRVVRDVQTVNGHRPFHSPLTVDQRANHVAGQRHYFDTGYIRQLRFDGLHVFVGVELDAYPDHIEVRQELYLKHDNRIRNVDTRHKTTVLKQFQKCLNDDFYRHREHGFGFFGFSIVVFGHHFEHFVRVVIVHQARTVNRTGVRVDDEVFSVGSSEWVLHFYVLSRVPVRRLKRRRDNFVIIKPSKCV